MRGAGGEGASPAAPGWVWPCRAPGLCPSGGARLGPGWHRDAQGQGEQVPGGVGVSRGGGSEAGSGQGRSEELPQVPDTEGPAAGYDFSQQGWHLRAISNSSGSSVLSFCMAISAMGPRITTGRLKLAAGRRQPGSGRLGARAELTAPRRPAPLLEVPGGLRLAPLLPGERSPLAPAAGQPWGQRPLGGSGRWGRSPGTHLPLGPPSRTAGSGPASSGPTGPPGSSAASS